jgi:hypothetical protein
MNIHCATRNIIAELGFENSLAVHLAAIRKKHEKAMAKWNLTLEAEKEELRTFDHGLDQSFGLLKSCRQAYHEAASVLFGHNTFLITRVLSRHDCFEKSPEEFEYH